MTAWTAAIGLLAAALFWAPRDAQATDLGPAPMPRHIAQPSEPWDFQVTPYGWAINLNGEQAIDGNKASVNVTFIDIVQEADTIAALEGRVEARKGKFSLLSVSDYFKATFSQGTVGNIQPNSVLNIDIEADISLDLELILSELSATYEIFRKSQGAPAGAWDQQGGFVAFDVYAGGRYNSIEVTTDVVLNVTATLTPQNIPVTVSRSGQLSARIAADEEWVDPFVGLRMRAVSAEGYALFARGDVGGFGVNSDFVWQAIAGISGPCRCNENLSWAIGYRALDIDYSNGQGDEEFLFDMLIHGPVVGATYRF